MGAKWQHTELQFLTPNDNLSAWGSPGSFLSLALGLEDNLMTERSLKRFWNFTILNLSLDDFPCNRGWLPGRGLEIFWLFHLRSFSPWVLWLCARKVTFWRPAGSRLRNFLLYISLSFFFLSSRIYFYTRAVSWCLDLSRSRRAVTSYVCFIVWKKMMKGRKKKYFMFSPSDLFACERAIHQVSENAYWSLFHIFVY